MGALSSRDAVSGTSGIGVNSSLMVSCVGSGVGKDSAGGAGSGVGGDGLLGGGIVGIMTVG